MFQGLTDQLFERALSAFGPQFEAISKARAEELTEIKSKIRTSPEEVEAWFDMEIKKVSTINVSDVIDRINK